jgi:hypothetical protein
METEKYYAKACIQRVFHAQISWERGMKSQVSTGQK